MHQATTRDFYPTLVVRTESLSTENKNMDLTQDYRSIVITNTPTKNNLLHAV